MDIYDPFLVRCCCCNDQFAIRDVKVAWKHNKRTIRAWSTVDAGRDATEIDHRIAEFALGLRPPASGRAAGNGVADFSNKIGTKAT